MTFRLAHLSDLHIAPLPSPGVLDLLSKRVLGYANWKRKRARHIVDWVLNSIVEDMKRAAPDAIAITGDLVNLALMEELVRARAFLKALGPCAHIAVVPGNHDAYVPGAVSRAAALWDGYMSGTTNDDHRFPYLRDYGDVALIGVSSAIASAPFLAIGEVKRAQRRRLAALLKQTEGRFRVVMIHHPPHENATHWHKRLVKAQKLRKILKLYGAELVLHGHTHQPTIAHLEGPDGHTIPVVGVAAAGEAPGSHRPAARWNELAIERTDAGWSCVMTAHVIEGPNRVTALSPVTLHGPSTALTAAS